MISKIRATILQFLWEFYRWFLVNLFENVKFIYHQGFRDGRNRLPPIKDGNLLIPASELAKKIVHQEIKSVDVMRSYIARIKAVDKHLNAMTTDFFESALGEAARVDALAAKTQDKEKLLQEMPFFGVPVTTKETVAIVGACMCLGSLQYEGNVHEHEAELMTEMKKGGAIVLCHTNVPEGSMWKETANLVHGRTNNPYDIHRTAGGSSGGEGALLGSAASVIGVGTDIGGSVRTPSAWCGVFGHKPTQGIVSSVGLHPDVPGTIGQFNTAGPMVRYAKDLRPMLKVLTKNAPQLKLDKMHDLKKLRIFFCEDEGATHISTVSGDVRQGIRNATKTLAKHLQLAEEPQPMITTALNKTYDLYLSRMTNVGAAPLEKFFHPDGINVKQEAFNKITGHSKYSIYPVLLSRMDQRYRGQNMKTIKEDLAELEKFEKELEKLGDDGVLILPPQFIPPPYHHGTYITMCDTWGTPGIFNIMNMPVTVCPIGLNSNGLPLSVAVAARRFNDGLCIQVAQLIEELFGGWTPPSTAADRKL